MSSSLFYVNYSVLIRFYSGWSPGFVLRQLVRADCTEGAEGLQTKPAPMHRAPYQNSNTNCVIKKVVLTFQWQNLQGYTRSLLAACMVHWGRLRLQPLVAEIFHTLFSSIYSDRKSVRFQRCSRSKSHGTDRLVGWILVRLLGLCFLLSCMKNLPLPRD